MFRYMLILQKNIPRIKIKPVLCNEQWIDNQKPHGDQGRGMLTPSHGSAESLACLPLAPQLFLPA